MRAGPIRRLCALAVALAISGPLPSSAAELRTRQSDRSFGALVESLKEAVEANGLPV